MRQSGNLGHHMSLCFLTALLLVLAGDLAVAAPTEETASEVHRLSVPLTYENRPMILQASLPNGSIFVQGTDSAEVLIEVSAERREPPGAAPEGMHRIPRAATPLDVREHENLVVLKIPWGSRPRTLHVTVPRKASMRLACVKACAIDVRDVEGELELNNSDGPVVALRIGGSVIATAINGDLTVAFDRIDPEKSMSFVTFNGNVDVTFPPDLAADLRISQAMGESFSDFDLDIRREKSRLETERNGRVRDLKLVEEVVAGVGGGGPEMQFKTWRGDIHIRRAGKRPGEADGPRR